MSTATSDTPVRREPELLGQTVVVIGGSAGIGLETARRARAEGAEVILTGRNPERLARAAREVGAMSTAAFDATELDRLERFFDDLPKPIDHVMVSGGGPYYAPLAEMDFAEVRAGRRAAPAAAAARRPPRHRHGAARRVAAVHRRHGRPPPRRRPHADRCAHRRDARAGREPGRGARADPGQPYRARLRRHGLVGVAARRRASTRAARSCAPRFRSGAWSDPEDVATLAVHLMSNTALTGGDLRHRRRPEAGLGRCALTRGRALDGHDRRTRARQRAGSAERSSRRELMPSFPNTLRRCHSTVRRLRNSWAPISGFVLPRPPTARSAPPAASARRASQRCACARSIRWPAPRGGRATRPAGARRASPASRGFLA